MPKLFIRDLAGGLNKQFPAHLIRDRECSTLLNCVYRNGKWTKRSGFTYPFSATADALEVIEVFDFLKKNGTSYLLCATPDGVYSLSGTSWIRELNLATTRAVTDKWFYAEIGNAIYVTNGKDNIYTATTLGGAGNNLSAITWDTTTDAQGNVGIQITRASVILATNSRLLFFNTNSSTDGEQPQRMYWTEVNAFNRVETLNFLNLDYSHSPIISAQILGSGLIAVYKTDSVVTVQNTGDPVFMPRFRAMTGLLAPKAVTFHPDGHFFVGTTGFYIFNAGRVIPIGDDRVVDYFYSNLNYSSKDNIYCFTSFKDREIYILYPDGTNTEPNKVLVYNWNYDNWAEWNFDAYCGFYRYRSVNPPEIYFGHTSGRVKKQGGTLDDSLVISTKIRTKAFSNTGGEGNPTPSDYVNVIDVRSDVSPSTASLVVAASDTGGATPTETTATPTITTGKAPRADFSVFGRYISIGADNFTDVSEFIVTWNEAGEI